MTKHKTGEEFVEPQGQQAVVEAPSEQPKPSLTDDLAVETLPDLTDFADEPSGSLPRGWYRAKVVEGYATRSGKELFTEDVLAKDGGSRNLRVAWAIQTPKESRNLQSQFNYRLSDFTPERLKYIQLMRKEMQGVKHWPDSDAQRSSLALAKIGQLQKAGAELEFIGGQVKTINLIGFEADVYVSFDGQYNNITQYAKLGSLTRATSKA